MTIDTDVEIYALGITGDSVIVVGDGEIITWNLPTGDHVSNTIVNIDDSVQTSMFNLPAHFESHFIYTALISPDFNHFAIVEFIGRGSVLCSIYDISTGNIL